MPPFSAASALLPEQRRIPDATTLASFGSHCERLSLQTDGPGSVVAFIYLTRHMASLQLHRQDLRLGQTRLTLTVSLSTASNLRATQ